VGNLTLTGACHAIRQSVTSFLHADSFRLRRQLRGVSHDLKDSGKHEIGVIAEEVGQVVPEVVSYEKPLASASLGDCLPLA